MTPARIFHVSFKKKTSVKHIKVVKQDHEREQDINLQLTKIDPEDTENYFRGGNH